MIENRPKALIHSIPAKKIQNGGNTGAMIGKKTLIIAAVDSINNASSSALGKLLRLRPVCPVETLAIMPMVMTPIAPKAKACTDKNGEISNQ